MEKKGKEGKSGLRQSILDAMTRFVAPKNGSRTRTAVFGDIVVEVQEREKRSFDEESFLAALKPGIRESVLTATPALDMEKVEKAIAEGKIPASLFQKFVKEEQPTYALSVKKAKGVA